MLELGPNIINVGVLEERKNEQELLGCLLLKIKSFGACHVQLLHSGMEFTFNTQYLITGSNAYWCVYQSLFLYPSLWVCIIAYRYKWLFNWTTVTTSSELQEVLNCYVWQVLQQVVIQHAVMANFAKMLGIWYKWGGIAASI